MNVCFIEDTTFHGGTQIWVSEAVERFIEMGISVSVLTPAGGWLADVMSTSAADLTVYDMQGVMDESEEHMDLWAGALREADIAVCTVHPPRGTFHCSVFAAKVIQSRGLKTHLVPKTGTIVPEYERSFYLPDERISSSVIAITRFTREYLIDSYGIPEDGVALVYQGTEVDLFTPDSERSAEATARYPVPENAGPVIGCVGSFEERKGQVLLLNAIAECVGQLPDLHLILLGDGPDEAMLKQKVQELGIAEHVSFFPFTREPVYAFERLDILVLPSLYKEGLPNVLLEAMSMGLPVVASRLAGIPEIVIEGETGYLIEPGDGKGLVDALVDLWSSKENYKRMASNARELMNASFDKRRQFTAFVEYFTKILS